MSMLPTEPLYPGFCVSSSLLTLTVLTKSLVTDMDKMAETSHLKEKEFLNIGQKWN